MLARGDAESASQAERGLYILRHTLLATLRAQVQAALRACGEDMKRSAATAEAVLRALVREKHDDGVQAPEIR